MSLNGEFIQQKSALEEVDIVVVRLLNVEATINEIKELNLKILTILDKFASQDQADRKSLHQR